VTTVSGIITAFTTLHDYEGVISEAHTICLQ